jgi:hypothetical protein
MIIKRNMAVDSLTRVCEESLALIKQLIDADNEVYAKGYEDGMAAQAEVQKTLKPWGDRNEVIEEVAKEIEKMTAFNPDTIDSFATYIRNMKT